MSDDARPEQTQDQMEPLRLVAGIRKREVFLDLGKPIAVVSLTPDKARHLARMLRELSDELDPGGAEP